MNRSQLITAIAEALKAENDEWTKADVKEVMETFELTVTETLSSGEPVMLGGFVKLARKDTPAKPARPGRNPATGETITLKPKPASVTVRASVLKKLKDEVIAASAPKPSSKKKKGKKKKSKK